MRRLLAVSLVFLGLMATAAGAAQNQSAKNPSPSQIRAALQGAEKSTNVWATVNICNRPPHYADDVGIRGQMPALGFAAWLSMDVKLLYYSHSAKRYVAVPTRGTKLVRLGRSSSGLQQGGALFQFSPHQPALKATIQFIWRRSGNLLGTTARTTTAGHRGADFGSPLHYSAATCKIK
jgi:hypothetical protein